MPTEAWLDSISAQIREIFAADQRIAQVTVERDWDTRAICRLIADDADARTVVGIIEPSDEWFRILTDAVRALGLADSPLDERDDSGVRRLRQVLDAFLETLVGIGARCLLVIDRAELLGRDVLRELVTLSYEAAANRLPLYVVLIQQEAVPEPVGFDLRPARPQRRAQRSAILAISLMGITGALLYARHASHKPASGQGSAAPARTATQSERMLGTTGVGSARTVVEQASTGAGNTNDAASADALMRQAARLAQQPNVRALLDLRQSIERQGKSEDVQSLAKKLDALVDQARRRQLDLDHRRLSEAERTSPR